MRNAVRVSATLFIACAAVFLGMRDAGAQALDRQGIATASPPPTLNFFGLPGLIDLPSGEAMPDGQVAVSVTHFAGQTRTNLSFQLTPRISGTFRYIGIRDWNSDGFDTYRDRSFDLRYQLFFEGRFRPAVNVGLQDLAGTGIYAAEYITATKTFRRPLTLPGTLKVTGGLGWGRLGRLGDIGSLSGGTRPVFDPSDTGGSPSFDQWFRGPVSPFLGLEWQVNPRLGFKAEYSPDDYQAETSRGVFDRESRLNIGAEYQVNRNLRLGAYYMFGSEIGFSAQYQFNPANPATPFAIAGPRPIIARPDRSVSPAAYDTAWASAQSAPLAVQNALVPELDADGIRLEAVQVSATRAEVRVSSLRYDNLAIVVGRTGRALARVMPASVETFDIVLVNNGLALSKTTLQRRDLETLELQPRASDTLLARSTLTEASPRPTADALRVQESYPRFSYALGPFLRTSYFDPDEPVRADVGLSLDWRYRFAPGWSVAGDLRYRLAGNIEDSDRLSNSVLPRVRTDGILFAREGDGLTIEDLFISHQWKPGANTYARVTAGYLEREFGGISAELLWKPVGNRLGLGVEANYARQRDFDQRFGFQDYDVFTGHVSAYYDIGKGYYGQVDVGRYLAGDVGATFTLERQFDNGVRLGGFFTLTDVSSEEFGEGSFDKGIKFTIPLNWLTGKPSRQQISSVIRPIQRDGGARLVVPDRLYEQVRDGHKTDLTADWGRVWE